MSGAKIEVAYGDSQGRPDIGTGEAERLIGREKVMAIVDMYPSVVTLAASAVAERMKTPFLASVSYADKNTERGFKYYFQHLAKMGSREVGGTWLMVGYMEHLAKVAGRKLERPAIIYEDTDYGQSGARALRIFLPERGYKIVADISYPSRIPDVTPIISQLKAAKADVVLVMCHLSDAILLAKTADRLEFYVPWIDAGGKAHYSFVKSLGEIAEYDHAMAGWNKDQGPKPIELNNRFRAKFGEDMPSEAVWTYQAIWVLKEAFELAKKADREALQMALRKIRIDSGAPAMFLPGFIKYGENGMNIGSELTIHQVHNGIWVTVFPEKYAAAKVKINPKWWK